MQQMVRAELLQEKTSNARIGGEVLKMREALEKEEQEHKETQKKFEELTGQHQNLMAWREDYVKETEKNEKELKRESDKKIQELEAEKKKKVDKLSEENASFQEKSKALKKKVANLRSKSVKKMEEAEREHRSQLDAKEEELAELKDKLKRQESENERVSEELKHNEHLRKVLDDENKKLKETEKKFKGEAKAIEDALNELAKLREGSGRVFRYKNDFDRYGVIYWMGSNFRTVAREHPSRKSDLAKKVSASRSSDKKGSASDLLNHTNTEKKISCTKEEKESWWWIALSEKYLLYLTHYTLRHGGDNNKSFLRNWQLEGSLDGSDCSWKVLKKHDSDCKLEKSSTHTATWSIEGEVGAFRFFKIVQTGRNSSTDFGIYLSGIELYGVLIKDLKR